MYAGKGYNSNPNSTKRSKLDRVAPVGNRPPTHKNGGPKQWSDKVSTPLSQLSLKHHTAQTVRDIDKCHKI